MAGVPHPDPIGGARYSAVELLPENDSVVMLDQRLLPGEQKYLHLHDAGQVAAAIRDMVVRGAPALGVSAAYAMVLSARASGADFDAQLAATADRLKAARPTAVNLAWAVDVMLESARRSAQRSPADRVDRLAEVARRIHREDVAANRTMSRIGAERVPDGATILTHCNAGALATGGYGTALGVIRAAHEAGKRIRVLADETRPYLQGARLTAWELAADGIEVAVITDASAGFFFAAGAIDLVVVGADRIAANGDIANKIGTYSVACLARAHERPFYVAAPWSTVDLRCPSGDRIPLEQRDGREVTHLGDRRLVPTGVRAENPAFDLTPARLVSAIFTERGAVEPVGPDRISALARAATAPTGVESSSV